MQKYIYNEVDIENSLSIYTYIEHFAAYGLGIEHVPINLAKIENITNHLMPDKFPHEDGFDDASVFKKAAFFLCNFIAEQPIQMPVPDNLRELTPYNLNAIIGFDVVVQALEGAKIKGRNGEADKVLSSPLRISKHAYLDILEMLCGGVTPQIHYKVIAILIEQIAYKNNPDCQYKECFYNGEPTVKPYSGA